MRFLLAEDERPLARAVAAILKRGGYTAEVVYDGQQALEALAAGSYDGAILDIMMPGHDGIQVLQRLRERGDLTPVLLLTAKSTVEDKVTGLDSGANDYLTKPFAARELLARVRAMTRTQAEHNSTQLRLGNIALDRATFALSSPTGSFRLAHKEFEVLVLLLCSAGHMVPAKRLRERIWGAEPETEPEVVLIYIAYLQKKLAALHASVRIVAEPDGYRLEEKAC